VAGKPNCRNYWNDPSCSGRFHFPAASPNSCTTGFLPSPANPVHEARCTFFEGYLMLCHPAANEMLPAASPFLLLSPTQLLHWRVGRCRIIQSKASPEAPPWRHLPGARCFKRRVLSQGAAVSRSARGRQGCGLSVSTFTASNSRIPGLDLSVPHQRHVPSSCAESLRRRARRAAVPCDHPRAGPLLHLLQGKVLQGGGSFRTLVQLVYGCSACAVPAVLRLDALRGRT
jgi:hypothetical protein